jgi:hypothetical protein
METSARRPTGRPSIVVSIGLKFVSSVYAETIGVPGQAEARRSSRRTAGELNKKG